jgi:hypothetical protein
VRRERLIASLTRHPARDTVGGEYGDDALGPPKRHVTAILTLGAFSKRVGGTATAARRCQRQPMTASVILWLRRDLRLHDHRARCRRAGGAVIRSPVLDDESPRAWRMGGAARWWLHHTLTDFAKALEGRGGFDPASRGGGRGDEG